MSGVFLGIVCALSFWTFWELNRLHTDTLEMNAFDDVYFDTHLLLNPDEIDDDDFDLTILEANISGQISMLLTSLDPDKAEEKRMREELWKRLQLDEWEPFNNAKSRKRLETLYTPEKIADLYPLLRGVRDVRRQRNGERFMRSLTLKSYLSLSLALLTIALGASFVCFEIYRRKASQDQSVRT